MEPEQSIPEMTRELTCLLRKYRGMLLDKYRDEKRVPPEVCDLISEELARLTKMIIPNVHHKINEVIVAAEQPTSHTVSKILVGADIVEQSTNSKTEVKVSVCNSVYVNFNWGFPTKQKDEKESDYRKRVRASIHDKTAYGGAILRVEDPLGKVMVQYRLSYPFLMEYFSRLNIGKTAKHNMRSALCEKCGKFHRLEKLAYWSKVIEFDRVDWDNVFSTTLVCVNC